MWLCMDIIQYHVGKQGNEKVSTYWTIVWKQITLQDKGKAELYDILIYHVYTHTYIEQLLMPNSTQCFMVVLLLS